MKKQRFRSNMPQIFFGDILDIRLIRSLPVNTSLVNMLCHLRGLE